VPNKAAAVIAAVPLLLQLAGCASSAAARADGSTTSSVATRAQAKSPLSEAAQNAKTFAEATQRGDAAWQIGQLERAIYYYVLALERSPQDAPTLAKIGAIEEARGDSTRAQKAFEMAHAAQPDEPHIAERLGRLYLQQSNFDSAAQIYAQVLAQHPERTRALDGIGEVCLERRQLPEAIHYFDLALQAEGADVSSVLTHRGYAKLLANDLSGAVTDLRAALAGTPQAATWQHMAELQTRQHDSAAALESLLNIMDTARAYNEIGVVLMKMNDYRAAANHFAKAISASPFWYEEAHRNLALAEEHLQGSAG
jgi:tetratricopeptide (TPR) repeat protein